MTKLILGSFLIVGALFYYQNDSEIDKSQSTIVKNEIVKDSKIIVVDKSSKITTPNLAINTKVTPKVFIPASVKTTEQKILDKQTLANTYKTNKPKATYQSMQQLRRTQALQMRQAQRMHQQRVAKRQQILKRYQMQQRAIATRSIQMEKINSQRIEQLNLRYKRINEKNIQKNISITKKLNQSS